MGLSFAMCADPVSFGRNVQETARLAAVHIPTLQFICVGVSPRRAGVRVPTPMYFRVPIRGKEQEPVLERIASEQGELLRDELRMLPRPPNA